MISGSISFIDCCVPKCPPASVPSATIAEAPSCSAILASFTEETIGTMATPYLRPTANISLEKPAPATIKSTFSSAAVVIKPKNSRAATIAFMPMIPLPPVNSLASLISFRNSSNFIPDAAIKPMPPSDATAAASRAVESLIAIPPCTIGTSATKLPILSTGNFNKYPPFQDNFFKEIP